ncbi:hypothetical protein [Winogradskyella flava]|uniref:hypothetical protein n=1 Tax=Winogradskyella flava TaxID=1884876 RepID=UPI0024914C3D|nr:hypothetical protein [Winogradskyella flava]
MNFNRNTDSFKAQEITMQRSKVVSLAEAVLEDPSNMLCQALLNQTMKRLEMLLSA